MNKREEWLCFHRSFLFCSFLSPSVVCASPAFASHVRSLIAPLWLQSCRCSGLPPLTSSLRFSLFCSPFHLPSTTPHPVPGYMHALLTPHSSFCFSPPHSPLFLLSYYLGLPCLPLLPAVYLSPTNTPSPPAIHPSHIHPPLSQPKQTASQQAQTLSSFQAITTARSAAAKSCLAAFGWNLEVRGCGSGP